MKLTDLITAWGETKSVAEWANDPRATAPAAIIAKRYDSGSLPESAIGYGSKLVKAIINTPFTADLYEAFGEVKSLRDWLQDHRCKAVPFIVRRRLQQGWTLEAALSEAPRLKTDQPEELAVTAWGEFKTVAAWLADPRCAVNKRTLNRRLRYGMAPEEAISTPDDKPNKLARVVAFGEVKSCREWANDPRCQVSETGLQLRILAGTDPERAITTPPVHKGGAGKSQRGPVEKHTLNGVTKTLNEWSKEARCVVSYTSLRKRLQAGWTLEDAMTTPSTSRATNSPKKGELEVKLYTGWGETKSLHEWFLDPRCKVGKVAVRSRLKAGCSLEVAISVENYGLWGGRERELLEAFGERKTYTEWWRDPRCVVGQKTLYGRLTDGWDLESALATPPKERPAHMPRGRAFITAWGETKSLTAWAADPRGAVADEMIQRRLKKGLSPEAAISNPPKVGRVTRRAAA